MVPSGGDSVGEPREMSRHVRVDRRGVKVPCGAAGIIRACPPRPWSPAAPDSSDPISSSACWHDGARVRVLDNFSTGLRDLLPFASRHAATLEIIEGDIRDLAAVERAAAGTQRHLPSGGHALGAAVGGGPAGRQREQRERAPCTCCRPPARPACRRVVYASSSSVYGANPDLPKREDQPPAPISPYAVSKAAGEQYAPSGAGSTRWRPWACATSTSSGPARIPASEYAAVIPRFILWALRGEPLEVHGDGTQSRDFTYVDNVVEANLLAARAGASAGRPSTSAAASASACSPSSRCSSAPLGRPLTAPPHAGARRRRAPYPGRHRQGQAPPGLHPAGRLRGGLSTDRRILQGAA